MITTQSQIDVVNTAKAALVAAQAVLDSNAAVATAAEADRQASQVQTDALAIQRNTAYAAYYAAINALALGGDTKAVDDAMIAVGALQAQLNDLATTTAGHDQARYTAQQLVNANRVTRNMKLSDLAAAIALLGTPVIVDPPPAVQALVFTSLGGDPGGRRGYAVTRALPTGELVYFAGANGHLPDGYNGIDALGAAGWRNIKPHTPWTTSGKDPASGYGIATGKSYLGNRDNHTFIPLWNINKLAIFQGEREPGVIGNYQGMVDLATGATVVDDTAGAMPGVDGTPLKLEDGASAWIRALGIGVQYGTFGNAADYLQLMVPSPEGNPFRFVTHANQQGSGPSFAGARGHRYVSNQCWDRGTQLHIYGGIGGDNNLYAIELSDVNAPFETIIATNTLPVEQQVRGECIVAYFDENIGKVVALDGPRCNTYDYATNVWASVPVPFAAHRVTPEEGGSGAIGAYCPQLKGGVVTWSSGAVELVTFGAAAVVPPPPPIPPVQPPPIVVVPADPPPATPNDLTPKPGHLRIVTTQKPQPVLLHPVLTGKHYGLVNINGQWEIAFGDHASVGEATPIPDWQDGNQQRYRWNLAAGTASLRDVYFRRSATPDADVQGALPDDGGIATDGSKIFVFPSERVIQRGTRTNPVTGLEGQTEYCRRQYGANIVVQEMGYITSIDPETGVHARVMPRPACMLGDRMWTPQYDAGRKFFFAIVANAGDLSFFQMSVNPDGTGNDDTWYGSDGKPQKLNWDSTGLGEITAHIAGLAVDWVGRRAYFYDHITTKLFSIGIDALRDRNGTAVLHAQFSGLGEPLNQSDQTGVKIEWDPDFNAVVINGIAGMYAYVPAVHECSVKQREDGFIGGSGTRVPTSFLKYDSGIKRLFSGGTIDWSDTNKVVSNDYWEHELQAA